MGFFFSNELAGWLTKIWKGQHQLITELTREGNPHFSPAHWGVNKSAVPMIWSKRHSFGCFIFKVLIKPELSPWIGLVVLELCRPNHNQILCGCPHVSAGHSVGGCWPQRMPVRFGAWSNGWERHTEKNSGNSRKAKAWIKHPKQKTTRGIRFENSDKLW